MSEGAGSHASDTSASGSVSEGSAYITSLSEHLAKLQRENIAIGDQNQQLAASLRDASTYNQVLGFDLYQLDQEIGELEARLSQSRSRIREIENQTKEITKQADACKNALLKDPEFAKLAKRLRSLQRTHSSAMANLEELRGILGDTKFSMLDGALQLMQEKVHFLYWSNTELHQQIELMQQLLKDGQESSVIRGELDKMRNISDLKLEWLQMRLYEEKMKQGKQQENDESTETDEVDSSAAEQEGGKRRRHRKKGKKEAEGASEEEQSKKKHRKHKKGQEKEDVDDYYDMDESDLGEERKGKNEKGHMVKRKKKKTKGSDGEYHMYEYEYDYDDLDEESKKPKKTKKRAKEHKKKGASELGYREITDPKTGEKVCVRMTIDDDGNVFEYRKTKDDDGKVRTTRRQLNDDHNGYKHFMRPVPGKDEKRRTRRATVFKDGDSWEYEYEYENDDATPTKKRVSEMDEDGFFDGYDPKTGEPVKMRFVMSVTGETYMDILKPDPKTNKEKYTRMVVNPRTKEPRHRRYHSKGGRVNGRRVRTRNADGEEYEYEYEYDEDMNRERKRLIENWDDHELEPIILRNKPRAEPGHFVECTDPETGEKILKRTVKGKDGRMYEDTRKPGSKRTRRQEVDTDGGVVEHKDGDKRCRVVRIRTSDGDEYEYEYDCDAPTEKKKLDSTKDRLIEAIGESNPTGFEENEADKTHGRSRTLQATNGDTYKDIEEIGPDGSVRIKRHVMATAGGGYRYRIVTDRDTGKRLRKRTTRVKNANDDEYEYEYEYDEEAESEVAPKKTKKKPSDEIDPIYRTLSKGRKRIHDEQDQPKQNVREQIHPVTGEKVKMELGDGNEHEFVLTSKGKPMKLKMTSTDGDSREIYAVIVDPKEGSKALRQRTLKLINNNDMALEYDDSDVDSDTGKPRRRVRELVRGDGLKPDHNGFYLRFDPETGELIKVRHVDGENGVYEDKMRVDPVTERIVIKRKKMPSQYKQRKGKKGNDLRVRRSRKRQLAGDDHEYEYEYDDENDKVKRTEVGKSEEELEKIKYTPDSNDEKRFIQRWRNAAGFREETDSETGEKVLKRRVKGKDGKLYEDILVIEPDGEQTILRQLLQDGKPVYEKTKHGRMRAVRVQHDDMREREYEYDYEYGSDPEDEMRHKQQRSKSQETLMPIGLDPRPDADGFFEEIDGETGEIIRARIVKGKDGILYKDIKRRDPKTGKERIERRQIGRDGTGKAWKKKRNPKTGKVYRTRRTRYRNDAGEEYEYEYQYDDEEIDEATNKPKCNRQKIRKEKENIDEIGAGHGFEEITDPKTGKKKRVRKVTGENGDIYLDELVEDEETGQAKIKRRKIEGDDDKWAYEEWEEDGQKKRTRRSRSHHLQRNAEQEYEYEYDAEGSYSRMAIDERDDKIDWIIPGASRMDRDEATERYVRRFVGEDGKLYEDVMTIAPDGKTHIVRRQLDKDGNGYAYKKKRHPKSGKVFRTRRSRHQNNDGDEYEYEYQYDEDFDGPCKRRRVAVSKEAITAIGNIPEFDEKKKERKNLLDVDESTFTEQIDPETGVVILVRRFEGEDGRLYEDVLFLDPLKQEKKVVRRWIGKDGETFHYQERENLKGTPVMTRHSRYRNERGEEYEYDYEYDEETEEGETIRLRTIIDNVEEEIIEPISKMPNRMRHRRRAPDAGREISTLSVGGARADGTEQSDHLAMALFLSEDKRMQVRQAKGEVVDLSEYENEASTNHVNPLSSLIPKLRAEKEMGSGEELAGTLKALEEEIEQRTAIRDRLKAQIEEMTKPPGHKKRKRLAFSGIRTTNVSAPPDPVKVLALTEFSRRSTAAQTDCTNDTINYQLSVLEQQKVERKAAEDLQSSLEILQKKIASTKEMIEDAKRDGEIKEEKIKELKTEIGNVKEELGREDENALKEEEKAREYADELEKVDQQIRSKQQQLEKVNSQVGALQMHLKEMQRFRMLLESELNDIYNRERPEIRQLIDDVKTFRNTIDETANKVSQMYKRVEAKRQAMEKLANSEEMRQYNDLRMQRVNLERRVKKWSTLVKDSRESLQALESFSAVNATRRQQLADTLKNKERLLMEKETEVEELERYAGLLEAMITEHKTNWV